MCFFRFFCKSHTPAHKTNYRGNNNQKTTSPYFSHPAVVLREGTDATLVIYGPETGIGLQAAELLAVQGISVEVVKLNRIIPIDTEVIFASVRKTGVFVAAEDVCSAGSVGERVVAAFAGEGLYPASIRRTNLGNGILENGAPDDLRRKTGLDAAGIAAAVTEAVNGKDKA